MNTIQGIIHDLENEETVIGGCTTSGEVIITLKGLVEENNLLKSKSKKIEQAKEMNDKLKHLITCMKCEVSGKCCDENCPTQYDAGNMGEIIENLEEISKILEQEPCEDAISRSSLLGKLDNCYKEKIKVAPDNMAEGFVQVEKLIKQEPPVTPTRKVGKWIEEKYQDYDDEYYWMYRCSECGRTVAHNYANITDVIKVYPFCHCGADMREVKENEM